MVAARGDFSTLIASAHLSIDTVIARTVSGISAMDPSREIARLLEIMAALRTPQTGCPWDLAQNFSTIAPYTLEEAYRKKRQRTKSARLAHSSAFQSRSLLYPALSNCRPKQAKSDLTGTIPARCCEKFARKPTRSKPNSRGPNETKPRLLPKSAICCLPWLISRATL